MDTFRFKKGLRFLLHGREYIVNEFLSPGELSLTDVQSGDTLWRLKEDLLNDLALKNLSVITNSIKKRKVMEIDLTAIPEDQRGVAKRRFSYVTKALYSGLKKKTKAALEPIILSVAIELNDCAPPHWTTLYRWLKDYEKSGDPRCLVSFNHEKGNRMSRMPREVHNIINNVIDNYYLTQERLSVTTVYQLIAAEIESVNKFRDFSDKLLIPSRQTIYNYVKAMDGYEVTKARYGANIADHEFKEVKTGPSPRRILERVEIDHTRSDLFVIDENTQLPLGRPTLTIALDKYSRCLLGYFLSFEPPSYLAVMRCLAHAIWPKSYMSEKYPDIAKTWCAYGIPEMLVVDNGKEFISSHLEDSCLQLGINLEFMPIKKPNYKGSVERYFRTLTDQLLHEIPGTTFSNIFQKGDYDPKKNAVITLDCLNHLIHKYVVEVYHQAKHRGSMHIPEKAWSKGAEEFEPRLPTSKEDLEIVLGYETERTIQRYGIELHGIKYNSEKLSHLRRNYQAGNKVKIKYNPSDLGLIWVYDPVQHVRIPVRSLNPEYADGLTLWQHRVVSEHAKNESGDSDIAALGKAKKEIQDIVQAEIAKQKKISSSSKIARWQKKGLSQKENSQSLDNMTLPHLLTIPDCFELESISASQPLKIENDMMNLSLSIPMIDSENLDMSGFSATCD